jgi:uncharacterized membrane protein YgdD (TMEM256/DUF423 family)
MIMAIWSRCELVPNWYAIGGDHNGGFNPLPPFFGASIFCPGARKAPFCHGTEPALRRYLRSKEQRMNERIWIGFAALAGALAAGADVAFRHLVTDPYRVDLGMIASRFGIYHALALIGVALLRERPLPNAAQWLLAVAAWCFVVGEGTFCLPLYLIGAGIAGWSGRLIVPGLIVLLAGWLALFAHVLVPRGGRPDG